MQIMMTPGLCSNEYSSTGGTFCESCFASFLMHGCAPDLACITNVVDDGKEATTLVLQHGAYEQAVELTDANRELLAFGGWPGWVQFVEELPSAKRFKSMSAWPLSFVESTDKTPPASKTSPVTCFWQVEHAKAAEKPGKLRRLCARKAICKARFSCWRPRLQANGTHESG